MWRLAGEEGWEEREKAGDGSGDGGAGGSSKPEMSWSSHAPEPCKALQEVTTKNHKCL